MITKTVCKTHPIHPEPIKVNRLNRLLCNFFSEGIRFRLGWGKRRWFEWIRIGKWTRGRWRLDHHHLFLLSYLLVQIFKGRITICKRISLLFENKWLRWIYWTYRRTVWRPCLNYCCSSTSEHLGRVKIINQSSHFGNNKKIKQTHKIIIQKPKKSRK